MVAYRQESRRETRWSRFASYCYSSLGHLVHYQGYYSMSGIEDFEESFLSLEGSDACPDCMGKLDPLKKFVSGTEFLWVGWCSKCNKDKITIHGNNPDRE